MKIKYGKLTILEKLGYDHNGHYKVLCVCDCGTIKEVGLLHMQNGKTLSCSCIRGEKFPEGIDRNSRIYKIWTGIKNRCNPKNNHKKDYANYSGKGIKLDDKWLKFSNFYNDMKDEYFDDLTIDRIDNNGPYCKENCRWTDAKTQANNRSSNILIEYNGKSQTLQQWCEELNINYMRTYKRLIIRGWSVEDSFEKEDQNIEQNYKRK